MEHVGWTLKGRCREVAVSFEHEFAGAVIYGETIKEGRWFYTLLTGNLAVQLKNQTQATLITMEK